MFWLPKKPKSTPKPDAPDKRPVEVKLEQLDPKIVESIDQAIERATERQPIRHDVYLEHITYIGGQYLQACETLRTLATNNADTLIKASKLVVDQEEYISYLENRLKEMGCSISILKRARSSMSEK